MCQCRESLLTVKGTAKLPDQGSNVFVFREVEHPEGGAPRSVAFTEVDIMPLGYEALEAARLHLPVTIPLEMRNGRIVETDIEEIDASGFVHIRTTLESPFTAQAIGLIRGGWLPSAVAATRSRAVVLPDRNVVTEISGRFEGGQSIQADRDFLDVFSNSKVRINPLLAAMEGNRREIPTPDEARTQIAEAVAKIRKALPDATLMVGSGSTTGLLGLIEDMRPGFERKRSLLMEIAPMLCRPIAQRDIDARWHEVLYAADEFDVPRNSLLVLALLITLVHPTGPCPPKKLLKLHDRYNEGDAYNALSDLRALDLLLYLLAFYPEMDIQVCTKDRQLALFWVGIGAHDISKAGRGIRYSICPHKSLLPERYADRWLEDVSESLKFNVENSHGDT